MCRCLIIQKHGGRVVGDCASPDIALASMDAVSQCFRKLYQIIPAPQCAGIVKQVNYLRVDNAE
jgi:hypothetical protein